MGISPKYFLLMNFVATLLTGNPYLIYPDFIGWLGWIILLIFSFYLLYRLRKYNRPFNRTRRLIFAVIGLLVPLTSLFFGISLSIGVDFTLPYHPVDPQGTTIMFLSAVPWVLAAIYLGPLSAATFAAGSGILLAFWNNHNLYSIPIAIILATVLSAALGQRFRTPFFRAIRHPLVASMGLILLVPFLYLYSIVFSSQSYLVDLVSYVLKTLPEFMVTQATLLFIAGLTAEIVVKFLPRVWLRQDELIPSPAEISLQTRFSYHVVPVALLLVFLIIASDWFIAEQAARKLLEGSMKSTAELAANQVPFFLETGQQIILTISEDDQLFITPKTKLDDLLEKYIRLSPFFSQLFVVDENGDAVNGYPLHDYTLAAPSLAERSGIDFALDGVPVQTYSARSNFGMETAQVSFITPYYDEDGQLLGVLIGRTELGNNALFQPVIASLQEFAGEDGSGLVIDENNQILIHPNSDLILTPYKGPDEKIAQFYMDTAPDATSQYVYYQPVPGSDWSIVLQMPARRVQSVALGIAVPLFAVILILSLVAMISVRNGLGMVIGSLKELSIEAVRIAQGNLGQPLKVSSVDEVGRLQQAFEQMRVSLKNKLDELNRLLAVSQEVASSLDMEDVLDPILEAALAIGACSARVVVAPTMVPKGMGWSNLPASFGKGFKQDIFSYLDEQILTINLKINRLVMSRPNRPKILHYSPSSVRPHALLALAIMHENQYYGSLWLAFDRAHNFTYEEIRYITILTSQAAIAIANASLYMRTEIDRQQLATILSSSPDPILVIDQFNHLQLANPAATQVLGLQFGVIPNQPVEKIITQPLLREMLLAKTEKNQSEEITLEDGRILYATTSVFRSDGVRKGKVCILRDVTYFKQLDTLKSEFVSTVSHDLRQPLTMMRGYATMLEMVGQLNDQQMSYLRKIVDGVESMSKLVTNLLDLGRIEAGVGLKLEMVFIRETVEKVTASQQIQAAQKRITMTMEIDADTPEWIEADQALLQQALLNLLENAVKYTRQNGNVEFRIQRVDDYIDFVVKDNGIGISPLDQPRLFEKFFRGGHDIGKDARGTGLGLAIVKSIADLHGGKVSVESQLGRGSTFMISLPLSREKIHLDNQK
jgi:two-component system phosphate regulon sensor histidine kinase PhoR